MPVYELYQMCNNIDIKTSVLLFNFMKEYNDIKKIEDFNDVIIDTLKLACYNNNINVIKNIINCIYNNVIHLNIYWIFINTNHLGLYYLVKIYMNRPKAIYSAFIDGAIYLCNSSESYKFIMYKSIMSCGYYEVEYKLFQNIINRIMI